MSGIQGRLNKQFAITIAISVLISAFNALTLSPALVGDAAASRARSRPGCSAASSALLQPRVRRGHATATSRVSHGLVRKAVIGVVAARRLHALAAVARAAAADQLRARGGLRLLPAERAAAAGGVARAHRRGVPQDRRRCWRTPKASATSTRSPASACCRASPPATTASTSSASSRGTSATAPSSRRGRSSTASTASCARDRPEATAFAVMPPSIPGLGTPGRLLVLAAGSQRRHRSTFLEPERAEVPRRGAASGPSWPASTSPFTRGGAAALRRRRSRQGAEAGRRARRRLPDDAGVPRRPLRQPVQPLRPAVARVPAGRRRRARQPDEHRPVLRAQQRRARWCRCRRSQTTKPTFGPQYTNRFNVYRAAQITGAAAPGYSSGQALDALEEVAKQTLPREIGYDWSRPVVPGEEGRRASRRGCSRCRSSFVFLILAALYESWSLPFSVLLSVPIAVFGAFARPAAAAASTSTSTRRSASSC